MELSNRVKLGYAQREYLVYLAKRGGEASLDWSLVSDMTPNKLAAKKMIDELVHLAIISETPVIGSGRVLHRLTDIGRNLVEQIEARKG